MNLQTQRGMTLVEIMIALAIMSMMMISVYSAFRGTRQGMEVAETYQTRYAVLRNCMSRMSAEIGMSYLSFNRPLGEDKHYTLFEGQDLTGGDNLTFSAFAHVRMRMDADESDQSVIQYVLLPDPENSERSHVYRRETRRLTGETPIQIEQRVPAFVFCEDVEKLEFRYWDDKKIEWVDEWRTTKKDMHPDRLPQRVMITMRVRDPNGELQTFTTQTILFMQERIDLSK